MNTDGTFAAVFIMGMILCGIWILVDAAEETKNRSRAIVTEPPEGEGFMEKMEKDRAEFDAKVERLVVAVESLAIQGAAA